ncbi:MAG: TRAP transporter large permease subunit, partial [Candidatus Bipolaricaulaceae bacterium]
RSGVRPEVATGLIAGSSVLGMLIPPSILMIVYGLLTDQPIGKLFIAGVVPGVLVVVAYSAYILIMGPRLYERGRNGVSSPDSTVALERVSFGGVFGLVATIVILLGGIYTGIFTVVEAAAIGAALAVASSVVSRRLDLIGIGSALASSVVTTASIGIIFLSANFYSKAIALVGLPGSIQRLLSEADVSRELVLLLVCLVIFALGFVLDTVSTLTIVIPVAYPILTSFNVDLIWFGILAILAAEMGLITPPVGLSVYALKAALPEEADVPVEDIFKGSIPFLLLMILVFTLVFFFPGLLL